MKKFMVLMAAIVCVGSVQATDYVRSQRLLILSPQIVYPTVGPAAVTVQQQEVAPTCNQQRLVVQQSNVYDPARVVVQEQQVCSQGVCAAPQQFTIQQPQPVVAQPTPVVGSYVAPTAALNVQTGYTCPITSRLLLRQSYPSFRSSIVIGSSNFSYNRSRFVIDPLRVRLQVRNNVPVVNNRIVVNNPTPVVRNQVIVNNAQPVVRDRVVIREQGLLNVNPSVNVIGKVKVKGIGNSVRLP